MGSNRKSRLPNRKSRLPNRRSRLPNRKSGHLLSLQSKKNRSKRKKHLLKLITSKIMSLQMTADQKLKRNRKKGGILLIKVILKITKSEKRRRKRKRKKSRKRT